MSRKEGMMEEQYIADRSTLRALLHQYPQWTMGDYARALRRSISWVKKWKARFRTAPDDPNVIFGQSRSHPQPAVFSPVVIAQILAIRDDPPAELHRTPGPKAILYYLPRTAAIAQERLPRSTRTVWKILHACERIKREKSYPHHVVERPEPMMEWQLDFKDLIQVDPAISQKQAQADEVMHVVDVGTSLWLLGAPSATYTAETVFAPLLHLMDQLGLPDRIRFDRDPRFMGASGMRDFPTPFIRFWYALGVQPCVNPPHRPDLNAFVERLHGTVEREYRQITPPTTMEEVQATLPGFREEYNHDRPHQGLTCCNRPPAIANAQLPLRPRLPEQVDPDRWLDAFHDRCFARRVKANGSVMLDERAYYVGTAYVGSDIVVQVDAVFRRLAFLHHKEIIKTLPLKGLVGHPMPLAAFVAWCEQEARSLWRQYLRSQRLAIAG